MALNFNNRSESFVRVLLHAFKLDYTLSMALFSLVSVGLIILYSASGEDVGVLLRQIFRLGLAFALLVFVAQITPHQLKLWTPWVYVFGVLMLVAVFLFGDIGKGAQRWLNLGIVRFQPSEMMKIAVPMMVAWYLSERSVPPRFWDVVVAVIIVLVPMVLIVEQPDLGTALLVGAAGFLALFLAGISWRIMITGGVLAAAAVPLMWFKFMHDYQRQRVLTFLNPESDPLGSGYHIIQSKIAIGSGGVYGKGWTNGTQSHLDFLPERSTDFIFAVFGEEFGWFGAVILLGMYAFLIYRCWRIALRARDRYSRVLGGALTLTFFVYVFVNVGMVIGLLPVVGVPLPLISYGGTSMVTLMAGFGMLMSINSDRRLSQG
ncbi:MAG: rod shape-determining protein RodA [Gammaproteobacteria bacterium]|nr:rod shape-determining protein RodA [Gammaproteobacteria bacterium]